MSAVRASRPWRTGVSGLAGRGPRARVAVELSARSARALAAVITAALAAVPPELAE